jgi:HAD superfamily hydrolase (TIGR01490 family)
MRLAIFDIDGTLLDCRSELRFWGYLFAKRKQRVKQVAQFLLFALRAWPLFGRDTLKKDKAYLTGLGTEEVAALAREFVENRLLVYLNPAVKARLDHHLRQGDAVVLVSGTLQPIARALADHLGVTHICATVCAERDGRYLAAPPQLHPYGGVKRQLTSKLAGQFGVSGDRITAYGNARNDIEMLEAAGRAVAVRPDRGLRAAAAQRGWEIIE